MLTNEDFLLFLKDAPTSYHCVAEVKKRLLEKGFIPLCEKKPWNLEKGKNYFISRGGSIAAFCIPKNSIDAFCLLAAHTDSPSLKLKPHPIKEQEGMYVLSTQVYGGPIFHTWLSTDLTIAGRYFTKEGDEHLLHLSSIGIMIPEIAIHLDREINKGRSINPQEHLMPLVCMAEEEMPLTLPSLLGVDHVESFDLFLVPKNPPQYLGLHREWIGSYRIDNLTSVHAAVSALLSYEESPILPLAVFFDHEEIGSRSWEGAGSSFLPDLLMRLKVSLQITEERFLQIKSSSLCYSLDMAHALDPLYSKKHDAMHRPLLGKGLVIKEHSEQKYATSGYTKAQAKRVAALAKVPVQDFASRSDTPSGSTIGPIITALTGIPTVDIGCPQLAMHATRELVSVRDYENSVLFLKQALKTPLYKEL